MSKEKIASIFRKRWFNAALFGLAALIIFLMTKNVFLTGVSVGMGIMYFITLFRNNYMRKRANEK